MLERKIIAIEVESIDGHTESLYFNGVLNIESMGANISHIELALFPHDKTIKTFLFDSSIYINLYGKKERAIDLIRARLAKIIKSLQFFDYLYSELEKEDITILYNPYEHMNINISDMHFDL